MEIFNILVMVVPLLSGLLVISCENPIYVVLSLLSAFLVTAVCWGNLGAEFLAFSLVLLYAGATVVLLLFVIMMLKYSHGENFTNLNVKQDRKKYFLLNKLFPLVMIVMVASVFIYIAKDYNFSVTIVAANNNLIMLASELFSSHMLLFTLLGLFLLTAIVVVVCLINPQCQTIEKDL
jgi:NADH-quinone oxidoreductase subunit J